MDIKEKRLLYTLAAVQFTHIVDFMIMMPLGPQLMRIFDITPAAFGALVSSYTITAGIVGFLAAFFIDRFDRKVALKISYLGFTLGTLACAFAPDYFWLITTRSIAGAFGGVLGALIFSIMGDAIPFQRRGAAMGIVTASFSLASVLGVPFSLYLASVFSWHAPFLFLGIFGIVILGIIQLYIPKLNSHIVEKIDRPKPLEILKRAAFLPNQRLSLTFSFFLVLGHFAIIPYISPYMVANVGFTEQQLTFIYFFGGAATIISAPLVGRWADRVGKVKVFKFFAIANLIPMFLITHMPVVGIYLALITTTIFFIFTNGRMIPANALVTATVRTENRGSFMSLNASVQQLTSGLAAFVSGLIITKSSDGSLQNYNYVGYFAIGFSIVAIWIGTKLRPIE